MLVDKIEQLEEKMKSLENFSGAVQIKERDEVILKDAFGYADIRNSIKNNVHTRFGIASGAKLLTAIGICKLVDEGLIDFGTLLKDCLPIDFPNFDSQVTIHHLLTHSSGIPDYFDEETMDDFSELWIHNPMYLLREPKDFLPMFQQSKMMFAPGEKFYYNNGAFIVLGLVIEHVAKIPFVDFVQQKIFDPLEMKDSGYFVLDQLPGNCAYGYLEDEAGTLKTNIYSIPVVGGPDGGVFMTVDDMSKLWQGLIHCKLLSEKVTTKLLTPQIHDDGEFYYGYGIWIRKKDEKVWKYFLTGMDPGIRFMSSYYPEAQIEVTALANREFGPYDITMHVESLFSERDGK
ncbi:serine hydrolase domain-containing protein [Rubeoparvulum massiliense]|uniref:serine hydrolase domain-containing protein n=1 Tax=Rubeoparvulum massiliense TaxID=1631346 RepID=UPI00065E2E9C|nr:serine hydrolase [Rubeoparvulum massiliense]